MGLKTRLNNLEQSIKPKEKNPVEEWRQRVQRMEELDNLHFSILEGDLQACIRACQLEDENIVDRSYAYRDAYVTIVAEREGLHPDLESENSIDVWYQNMKATYRYLEARAADPQAKEPNLKICKNPD